MDSHQVGLDRFKRNDCQRWNFIPEGVEIGTNLRASMHARYVSRTAILRNIPGRIPSPKIEYKLRTPSSANFTGRRDYLTKLRDYFSVKPDEPLRRKSFLLYGMGGIGKTQICLKFTEENWDL
jgi:hypothetical protein